MKKQIMPGRFSPAIGIILAIFLAIAIFSFSSCMNEKKVQRWNNEHPEQEAKNCATKYPIKAGDTIVNNWLDTFDFSRDLADVNEYINYLNAVNDSLVDILLRSDTSCSKYAATIADQSKKISDLNFRIKNIKPVINHIDSTFTKIDSAAVTACRLENARLKVEAQKKDKSITDLTLKTRSRFWMLIAAGLAIILLIILLFKKKSNPIINAVT